MHLWSFCLGARNALVGVAALIGLWFVNYADESAGATIVIISCIYMLLAALFMGLVDLLGYWRPRGGSIRELSRRPSFQGSHWSRSPPSALLAQQHAVITLTS